MSTSPPGPARSFPGRHLLALHRHPLDFLLGMAQKYGDIVTLPLGRQPVILLNHPDFIKQILANDAIQPAGAQRLAVGCQEWAGSQLTEESAAFIAEEAAALSRQWQEGVAVDVVQAMTKLSLRIALRTLFAAEPASLDLRSLQRGLDDLITGGNPCDIFGFVRVQRHEHRLAAQQEALLPPLPPTTTGYSHNDTPRTHALLLAAYELPANVLIWAWRLLAQHPRAWAQLREELAQTLGERPPTKEQTSRLRFSSWVLAETLRLYPPVWMIAYQNLNALQIGGYDVPAGSRLLLSPWALHHDPRYFPDPFAFLPERWQANGNVTALPYFPCGAATTLHMDASFFWNESILLLATLAQRWRLRLPADYEGTLQSCLTLRPRHGLPMTPTHDEVQP